MQNEIESLQSELLGKKVKIHNLCKVIDEFNKQLTNSNIELDEDGILYKTYMDMLNMRYVEGNTISLYKGGKRCP